MSIHPGAIAKLVGKKLESAERAKESTLKIELLDWNICPECGADLNSEMKKWYQFFKPDYRKECVDCGKVYKRNIPSGRPGLVPR